MFINNWIVINKAAVARNSVALPLLLLEGPDLSPEKLYDHLQCSYSKFYKMDMLCKWAITGAAYLFAGADPGSKTDSSKIAVVMTTGYGCLDVDKRYHDSISIPSPALFVYTLPNIMLGELCIRYGFKGEQLCMISEKFDAHELYFSVQELITSRGMDACLCGWINAYGDQYDVCLFWVTKNSNGSKFTPAALQELYDYGQVKTR